MLHVHMKFTLSFLYLPNSLTLLTFFDLQINGYVTSWRRFWITNGLTYIFTRVIITNVWNFKTSIDVACSWWQGESTTAGPSNFGTNWTFVTTLEDNFATCSVSKNSISFVGLIVAFYGTNMHRKGVLKKGSCTTFGLNFE